MGVLAALLLSLPLLCIAGFRPAVIRPDTVGVASVSAGHSSQGAGKPGYIRTTLQRTVHNVTDKTHRRRWTSEPLIEYQAGVEYMMEIDIGNPRQTIKVIVDTGSWELYINPNCDRASDQTFCINSGHYYPTRSSTSRNLTSRYYVSFGTGGFVGDYFSDTLWFGTDYWPVTNLQFGVSDDSDYIWAGVLGLGYGQRFNTKYTTLLDLLVLEGFISVPIFSLGVGGEGSGSGDLIMGGVDSHKYSGWLEPVELFPPPDTQESMWNKAQYWVNLTSLGYTVPGQAMTSMTDDSFATIVLVDTGSTYSYIDAGLVARLAQQFSATIDEQGVYYVPCKFRDMEGYVHFGFNQGNMIIDVKYRDFIISFGSRCALGVQPADAGVNTWVLGDTFIRAAYIVFDQLYDVLWLANYQSCGDALVTDLTGDAGNQLWYDLYGGC
ncbi:aspartic peptidase domain-containing protein [Xylariales sp. AK1849]|nr:aspartic peptidase domain-containing protein [Xylariales sp. AK1849]